MTKLPFKAGNVNKGANRNIKGRDSTVIPKQTPAPRARELKNKSLPKKPNSEASRSKEGKPGKGRGLERTAKRLTDSVIRDEVQDLRGQRREISRAARHAKKEVRNQYQRGMGDLDYVAGETSDYVASQNAQAQAGFNAQSLEQNAAAMALQNQLQNVYDAGEGSATAEMSRLGITGASGFLGQLASDRANAATMGAQTSSNNAANLGLAQANAGAVGNLLSGMVQGTYLSGIGQNLNSRNDGMNSLREEEQDQLSLVREAIREAQGSRKDTFFQLLQQLRQTGWGR